MNRRDFIRICGLIGISIPFQPISASAKNSHSFRGKVLIVGAGAAGLTAGYLLHQLGIDFEIIEAANTYGGRMKKNETFTDFPISLGGEWLQIGKKELTEIVNNPSKEITTVYKEYKKDDEVAYYEEEELSYSTLLEDFGPTYKDKKFVNATWLDFFEEYLLPDIAGKIRFNRPIVSIDYEEDTVWLTDQFGQEYEADKVIVTVPLKMLQDEAIEFTPALPDYKIEAIQKANIWGGIKVFIQFSEKFYPTFLTFPDTENSKGQRLYYDAAYGQKTKSNILGLFAVGAQAEPYQEYSDSKQIDYILEELDEIFDGKASSNYEKHIIQNWSDEPFIHAAYLADMAPAYISTDMSYSIDDKVYFAGTAYTKKDDWGSVHNAIYSAQDAVNEIAQ